MKLGAIFLLAGLTTAALCAAPAEVTLFSLIGGDYKKPQEVPENFFNPFKVQLAGGAALQKKANVLTNESVSEAVGRRGVSGLIYAEPATMSRVIIGDQVFGVGDELAFPDGDKGGTAPLVPGANVVLRDVGAENLRLDVTPEGGEATREVNFPLRNFWRP